MVKPVVGERLSQIVKAFTEKVGKLGNHEIKQASTAGGAFTRFINSLMAFLGVKPQTKSEHKGTDVPPKAQKTAQKTNRVGKRLSGFAAEVKELPFEKARKGGPATEVFESAITDPKGTKAAAKIHYDGLKKQIENQVDHSEINALGEKLNLSFNRSASFGQKVKQAREHIAKTSEETKGALEKLNGDIRRLQEEQATLQKKIKDSTQMSELRTQTNADNNTNIAKWIKEKENFLKQWDETKKTKSSDQEQQLTKLDQKIDNRKTLINASEKQNMNNQEANANEMGKRTDWTGKIETTNDKIKEIEDNRLKRYFERDKYSKMEGELEGVKQQAGKKSEGLLTELLITYVLYQAVDSYSLYFPEPENHQYSEEIKQKLVQSFRTPTPQKPNAVLNTFKTMNEAALKESFINELADSGIIIPDIVWDQLNPEL